MYENLTQEERLNRIAEILLKGIYLYAEQQGWIKEDNPINCTKKQLTKNKLYAKLDNHGYKSIESFTNLS
jgi:hypothetical protein